MTKAELTARVAGQLSLTKTQTERIVDLFFSSIVDALQRGDKVELRGFGSFRIRHRSPRKGRNPKTGEPVSIAAQRVPFFKAGQELRARVAPVLVSDVEETC